MAQTSDRVSSIAARYINMSGDLLQNQIRERGWPTVAKEIQSMAASLLAQDEVRGLRGRIKKLFAGK